MAQDKVDLPMAVEVNQPFKSPVVRNQLFACVKHFHKHAWLNYGYPNDKSTATGWQMGGNMAYLQGGAAGFLLRDQGPDSIGLWSWMALGVPDLCVISAYKVGMGIPQIITDGRESDFLALLRFFQVAATQLPNKAPSVLEHLDLLAAGPTY